MANLTLSLQECTEALTSCGFRIGLDKLMYGLRQDVERERPVFPFGNAMRMPSGNWAYVIYRKDLADYIKQHGGDPKNVMKEAPEMA